MEDEKTMKYHGSRSYNYDEENNPVTKTEES